MLPSLETLLAFVVVIVLIAAVAHRRADRPVPDGPDDEPYQVYTREFDLVLSAPDVPHRLLSASPDAGRGWAGVSEPLWLHTTGTARALLVTDRFLELPGQLAAKLGSSFAGQVALSILIDQSGSMKGAPISWTTASVAALTPALQQSGIRTEILGFSTAGWHGGFAYRAWRRAGRPPRPGRLCALMHVIYKEADEPVLSEDGWQALLHPDLLRENIDGEALLWAAERLGARPEPRRILLVISDGAPVDDATLLHNGPSYLYRHLSHSIDRLGAEGEIELVAVGIGHQVNTLYPASAHVPNIEDLPEVLVEFLPAVLSVQHQRGRGEEE